ncbi:MAG: EAL domain-containing protein [Gammaproteobacteria bacterium]|nr:EAL domain-containing protein [Gammaproteobacteria bacterium]
MSDKPIILITDDIKANRLALKKLLRSVDAEIIEAESGNETLSKALVSSRLALILLDVQMPEMDGFEVAELLREEDRTQFVPIIFVTGMDRNDIYRQKGYSVGAVDYLYKPVDPDILLSKVNVFLDLWRMRSELEHEIELRIDAEMQIQHMAYHDALTCLPNRRKLYENLTEAMHRCDRYENKLALLFLDLDGFKRINDTLGHNFGDEVLLQMAGRYQSLIRNTDSLARFGGDEFVILLTDINNTESLVSKMQEILEVTHAPVDLENNQVSLGVSIGAAYYPDHGNSLEELVSHADKAMYQAKNEGKNTFRIYSVEMDDTVSEQLSIEKHLANALINEEFSLVYQPIVSLPDKQVVAVEVLLRWNNPEIGFVGPDVFIPIAEEMGEINSIGSWVLHKACKQLAYWNKHLNVNLRMCVNVSTVQFNDPEQRLLRDVKEILSQGEIHASQLELEITEGLLIRQNNNLSSQLNQLVNLGVALAIDDFGTGYSSLSYLKKYPISTLKIDRSFVMDIPNDEEDCVLVKAIVAMSHGLGLKVIAEGIEDEKQLTFLSLLNCNFGQGYYFSKPLCATDLDVFIQQHPVCHNDVVEVKKLLTGSV